MNGEPRKVPGNWSAVNHNGALLHYRRDLTGAHVIVSYRDWRAEWEWMLYTRDYSGAYLSGYLPTSSGYRPTALQAMRRAEARAKHAGFRL